MSEPLVLIGQGIADWPRDDVRWSVLETVCPNRGELARLLDDASYAYGELVTHMLADGAPQEARGSALTERERRQKKRAGARDDILELAAVKKRLTRVIADYNDCEDTNEELQGQLEAARRIDAELVIDNATLRNQLDADNATLRNQLTAAQRANKQNDADRDASTSMLRAINQRLRDATARVSALELEIVDATDASAVTGEAMITLGERAADLDAEVRVLRDAVRSSTIRAQSATHAQRDAELALTELEAKLHRSKRTIAALRESLDTFECPDVGEVPARADQVAELQLELRACRDEALEMARRDTGDGGDGDAAPLATTSTTTRPPAPPAPPPRGKQPIERAVRETIAADATPGQPEVVVVDPRTPPTPRATFLEQLKVGHTLKPVDPKERPPLPANNQPAEKSLRDVLVTAIIARQRQLSGGDSSGGTPGGSVSDDNGDEWDEDDTVPAADDTAPATTTTISKACRAFARHRQRRSAHALYQ